MFIEKIKRSGTLVSLILIIFATVLYPTRKAWAAADGGDGGTGGGNGGCGQWPNTGCGGKGGYDWFFESFEDGDRPVITVSKRGTSGPYVKSITATYEGCGKAPGIFFYGMVLRDGSPAGVSSIGNPSSIFYRSDKLAGGRGYYRGSTFTWGFVQERYADAYANDTSGKLAQFGPNAMDYDNIGSKLGWFCANSEPEPPKPPEPPEPPKECPIEGVAIGSDRGESKAISAVANLSKGEPLDIKSNSPYLHTSINGKPITYAKPGDSIQFMHAYCYGASAVQWNETHGTERYYVTATNKFSITATSTNGGTKEYRFGGAGTNAKTKLQADIFDDEIEFKLGGEKVPVKEGAHTVKALESVVDYNGDYFFVTYSPSIDAGDRYDCLHIPFITTNPFLPPGYQINGFTELQGTCKSKKEVSRYADEKKRNDPGTTITQILKWSKTRAWITKGYDDDGECNCHGGSSRIVKNYERPTFDSNDGKNTGNSDLTGQLCFSSMCQEGDCDKPVEERTNCKEWWGYDSKGIKIWRPFMKEWENEMDDEPVHAVIPYNYNTYASSSIDTGEDVYIGEQINTSFNWGLTSRDNPDVYKYSYATMSRPTKIQIVEFTIDPHGTKSPKSGVIGNNKSDSDPCGYYGRNLSAKGCHSIYDSETIMNEKGHYGGSKNYSQSFTRQLPDVQPGTKYCVAMGVWPADSHNRPDESLGEGDNNPFTKGTESGQDTKVGYWRIANASCRTLYKKPNFQVWGAGLYSNKGISTSISEKTNLGGGLSKNQGNEKRGPSNIFGSWDEYAVIAGGQLKGFASAAGYGYETNLQIQPPGGDKSGSYNLCNNLSRLTLGGCNGVGGGVNVSDVTVDRLTARYLPSSSEINLLPDATGDRAGYCSYFPGYDYCKQLTSGATYIRVKNNGELVKNNNKTPKILSPGKSNLRADGNVDNLGTVIIDATGRTLNINANICYLDESCNTSGDENYLRSDSTDIYDIATLPQVLIFAKDINIDQNVTQIDAWLIADSTINTCDDFSAGGYGSNGEVISGTNMWTCAKTLTVNGPVFARSLKLNRMSGADPGSGKAETPKEKPHLQNLANDGSITPAEIFNLRPDTYYWAYSQAQRYSQALVTYTRELAPRY